VIKEYQTWNQTEIEVLPIAKSYEMQVLLRSLGPMFYDINTRLTDDASFNEGWENMSYVAELLNCFYNEGLMDLDIDNDTGAMIADGRLAAVIGGPEMLPHIISAAEEDPSQQWSVARLPVKSGEQRYNDVDLGGSSWAVTTNDPDRYDLIREFLVDAFYDNVKSVIAMAQNGIMPDYNIEGLNIEGISYPDEFGPEYALSDLQKEMYPSVFEISQSASYAPMPISANEHYEIVTYHLTRYMTNETTLDTLQYEMCYDLTSFCNDIQQYGINYAGLYSAVDVLTHGLWFHYNGRSSIQDIYQ
jgi:hypothetical protein